MSPDTRFWRPVVGAGAPRGSHREADAGMTLAEAVQSWNSDFDLERGWQLWISYERQQGKDVRPKLQQPWPKQRNSDQ